MISCPNCNLKPDYLPKDKEVSYCSGCKHYIYNQLENKDVLFSHDHVGDYQYKTRQKQFKKVFDFILSKDLNYNFLEIGAGFGGYINYANNKGFNCTAIDIDDYYKNQYEESGIKFIKADANELDINIDSNVVILSHIVEHLEKPKKLLNYLINQNVDYLIIEVPSSHGMIFKLSKLFLNLNIFFIWNRLWQKNSNSPHLHYFSDESMYEMSNDCRFKIETTIGSRFATLRGSFQRTLTTENLITSLISVIVIQILELLNHLTKCPENKIYILRNLNKK
tara:strand:+ start:3225 stop:4061 length:837 start_codon:yes stop_codon:yes gene_type:complete